MTQQDLLVTDKIILAAISCIEKDGIHSVTTRSIAREADVNIAAINYYFSSKDKLIEKAFDHINRDFMKDCLDIIEKEGSRDEVINDFLAYIMSGSVKYPNIIRAFFYDPFINNKYDDPMVKNLNMIMSKLYKKLSCGVSEEDMDELKKILLETITSCLFIGAFPDYFQAFSGMDLKDPSCLRMYVSRLAKNIILTIEHTA